MPGFAAVTKSQRGRQGQCASVQTRTIAAAHDEEHGGSRAGTVGLPPALQVGPFAVVPVGGTLVGLHVNIEDYGAAATAGSRGAPLHRF